MLRKTGSRRVRLQPEPVIESAPSSDGGRGWEARKDPTMRRHGSKFQDVWNLWGLTLAKHCPEAALALPAKPSQEWPALRELRNDYNLMLLEQLFTLAALDWPAIRTRYRWCASAEYPNISIVAKLRRDLLPLAMTGRGVVDAHHRISRYAESLCKRVHKDPAPKTKAAPPVEKPADDFDKWKDV